MLIRIKYCDVANCKIEHN